MCPALSLHVIALGPFESKGNQTKADSLERRIFVIGLWGGSYLVGTFQDSHLVAKILSFRYIIVAVQSFACAISSFHTLTSQNYIQL